MVVSGEGGTGKTWLIKHIIEGLCGLVGRVVAKNQVALMAHQGSAAFLIGGRTLSSCLALPSHAGANFNSRYVPLTSSVGEQTSLRRIQHECEHVKIIIINEFGVVSCGMLDWIDQRFRDVFPDNRDKPFGGRDVLFAGDPGQLDPIRPSTLATSTTMLNNESERQGRRLWAAIDTYYVLEQQNRGISDPEWYAMLKQLRSGVQLRAYVELINTRVIPQPNVSSKTMYLSTEMSTLPTQTSPC